MSVQERNRQLRVVAEIIIIHVPDLIDKDQALARDLLSVAGTALHRISEDAEQSAKSWDKRAYHVRADELRREWRWALGAGNYALGLAQQQNRVNEESLRKLRTLIGPDLDKPARKQIKDPQAFRGAAKVVKHQQDNRKKAIRW